MADRRERTAEEREAARLDRERKRAMRRGETPPPEPAPQAREPEPVMVPASSTPPAPAPPPPAPAPPSRSEPEIDGDGSDDLRTGEHEVDRGDHGLDGGEPEIETGHDDLGTGEHDLGTGEHEFANADHNPGNGDRGRDSQEPELETGEHDLGTGEHDLGTGEPDLGTGEPDLGTGEHDLGTGEHDLGTGEHDLGTGDHELETGEHELEAPSGTRRVSVLDKPPVAPPPRKPPKRKPLQRKVRSGPGEGRRRHSWLVRIASLIALALAAGVIWFLIEAFQPFGTSPRGRITVTIPPHATSGQIADLLQHDGVVSSSFFFGVRATLDGDRGDMRSGVYHLQLGMSYGDVLDRLTKAPPAAKVTELTITEGRRRQQVDQLLRSQGVRGSYLAATRSSPLINPRAYGMKHKPRTLEGFLFPNTYQLVEPIRVQTLADDQVREFKKQFAKVNLSYARRHHLTPYDVLIIASLIEGETPTAHDRPLVSSVIYNRLANGMMLQLDSTTQYATGNFTRPLTVSQLHSGSPYNTRTHLGLPPTPIGNPGMASLQAAAHPAQTKYLFFFGKPCQRGSVFATNYSQFLNLQTKYQKKHC